jgi:methionyl-tRNA formyltransferase
VKANAIGQSTRRIAIVAKYPFYFDDICSALSNLDIQIVSAVEISEIQEQIENGISFDFIFFPHYSKMVPTNFLERNNCVGFHTGDLPDDRGGSPIQNKILRGEYSTWVSALKLIENLDAGDILCREAISIENGSIEEILRKISIVIARLIRIVVTENPIPSPQTRHTSISPRLKPQASELKFDDLEVKQIYDRIRMLDGLDYPPAYIQFDRYRIILSNAELQGNILTFISRLEEKK